MAGWGGVSVGYHAGMQQCISRVLPGTASFILFDEMAGKARKFVWGLAVCHRLTFLLFSTHTGWWCVSASQRSAPASCRAVAQPSKSQAAPRSASAASLAVEPKLLKDRGAARTM